MTDATVGEGSWRTIAAKFRLHGRRDPEPQAAFDVDAAPVPEWSTAAQVASSDPAPMAAVDVDDLDLDLVPFSLDEITGTVAPAHELDESVLAARAQERVGAALGCLAELERHGLAALRGQYQLGGRCAHAAYRQT